MPSESSPAGVQVAYNLQLKPDIMYSTENKFTNNKKVPKQPNPPLKVVHAKRSISLHSERVCFRCTRSYCSPFNRTIIRCIPLVCITCSECWSHQLKVSLTTAVQERTAPQSIRSHQDSSKQKAWQAQVAGFFSSYHAVWDPIQNADYRVYMITIATDHANPW